MVTLRPWRVSTDGRSAQGFEQSQSVGASKGVAGSLVPGFAGRRGEPRIDAAYVHWIRLDADSRSPECIEPAPRADVVPHGRRVVTKALEQGPKATRAGRLISPGGEWLKRRRRIGSGFGLTADLTSQ